MTTLGIRVRVRVRVRAGVRVQGWGVMRRAYERNEDVAGEAVTLEPVLVDDDARC